MSNLSFQIGSVNTEKRYYEVHTLPEDTDKRSVDDVMRVLVTWQDAAHAQEGLMAGDETMKRRTLDELEPLEEDGLQISEEEESEEESFEEDGVEIPEEEEESGKLNKHLIEIAHEQYDRIDAFERKRKKERQKVSK